MIETNQAPDENQSIRQRRMAVLARADSAAIARCWTALGIDPTFTMLRGPETGLVTLRGRVGGGGSPFNFGEATVTRATVRLESGAIGHSWALGRDQDKARLAAIIDALAQDTEMAGRIDEAVIRPLASAQDTDDRSRVAETAATRVDFFTMVRGED
ncbi:MAG: phosphonate C-P lyase system protein PhnG [Notoacmeibacter sp.]|nr:phosphonate C-P lyase system protein PhnG [Notoacmeibacter sp.]